MAKKSFFKKTNPYPAEEISDSNHPQSLSRKLVHILSGLFFMASWPIFRELLRGPLYYVLILILCALIFWRESPVGLISLAMMCGGDGIADIIGRRFGSLKIPYNQQKSWDAAILFCSGIFTFGLGPNSAKGRSSFFGGNCGGVPSNDGGSR